MLRVLRLPALGAATAVALCGAAAAQTTGSRINPAPSGPLEIIRFDEPSELAEIRTELSAGNVENALAAAHRLLASDPSPSIQYAGYNALCACHSAAKAWEEALEACDHAIRILPGHWMARNTRGNIFLLRGELERALEEFEAALASLAKGDSRRRIVEHNIALARSPEDIGG